MSNETKWTPGPWRINKYGSIGAGEFGSSPIVASIESFWGDAYLVEGDHQANARLIAAAPEMADALEPFSREANSYDPDEDDSHIHIWGDIKLTLGDLRAARAALRKARGEQ
jgi:hypothetical protein